MNISTPQGSPERPAGPAPSDPGHPQPGGEALAGAVRIRHVALYFDLVQTPVRREYISAWSDPGSSRDRDSLRGRQRAPLRAYQESSLPLE